ncbi:hypothetical protein J6590_079197 [Homalodisca vitripennis]|nr:hypothetical protein J6590_079197 [Homalodisca vitripennis]
MTTYTLPRPRTITAIVDVYFLEDKKCTTCTHPCTTRMRSTNGNTPLLISLLHNLSLEQFQIPRRFLLWALGFGSPPY